MKYQRLTNYIKVFTDHYCAGKWILGGEKSGGDVRPLRVPFVDYDSKIYDFTRDMNGFMDQQYDETLNNWGVNPQEEKEKIDVTEADDKEVLALITYVIRSERICDGEMKSVVESGTMKRWLERLREIDLENSVSV